MTEQARPQGSRIILRRIHWLYRNLQLVEDIALQCGGDSFMYPPELYIIVLLLCFCNMVNRGRKSDDNLRSLDHRSNKCNTYVQLHNDIHSQHFRGCHIHTHTHTYKAPPGSAHMQSLTHCGHGWSSVRGNVGSCATSATI